MASSIDRAAVRRDALESLRSEIREIDRNIENLRQRRIDMQQELVKLLLQTDIEKRAPIIERDHGNHR